jgi:hypothetical protein
MIWGTVECAAYTAQGEQDFHSQQGCWVRPGESSDTCLTSVRWRIGDVAGPAHNTTKSSQGPEGPERAYSRRTREGGGFQDSNNPDRRTESFVCNSLPVTAPLATSSIDCWNACGRQWSAFVEWSAGVQLTHWAVEIEQAGARLARPPL